MKVPLTHLNDEVLRQSFNKPDRIVACGRDAATGLVVGVDRNGHLAFLRTPPGPDLPPADQFERLGRDELRSETVLARISKRSDHPAAAYLLKHARGGHVTSHPLGPKAAPSHETNQAGAYVVADDALPALQKVQARLRRAWTGPFPYHAHPVSTQRELSYWLARMTAFVLRERFGRDAKWEPDGHFSARILVATGPAYRPDESSYAVYKPSPKTKRQMGYSGTDLWMVGPLRLVIPEVKRGRRREWQVGFTHLAWTIHVRLVARTIARRLIAVNEARNGKVRAWAEALTADLSAGRKVGASIQTVNPMLHVETATVDAKESHLGHLSLDLSIAGKDLAPAAAVYVTERLRQLQADLRRLSRTVARFRGPTDGETVVTGNAPG